MGPLIPLLELNQIIRSNFYSSHQCIDAPTGLEPAYAVLQTAASPFRHRAIVGNYLVQFGKLPSIAYRFLSYRDTQCLGLNGGSGGESRTPIDGFRDRRPTIGRHLKDRKDFTFNIFGVLTRLPNGSRIYLALLVLPLT